ncbi:M23 family metallopeptidase [Prolixibacteraceae bacterium JC049]|nr:M23 family metallopeptidase [Prolixibacteraceae bacterium JC049]
MAKVKYKFNSKTLSYEQVDHKVKHKVKKTLGFLFSSFVFGWVIFFLLTTFTMSPKEQALNRENKRLLAQYQLLDKEVNQMQKVLDDIQTRDDNIYRVIFEAEPIPSAVRKAGFGGANRYKKLESLENSELVISTARKLDVLSKQCYIQSKSFDEVLDLALNKEKMLLSIPAVMPVSNKDLRRTASGWGWRIDPVYKIRKFHYGMDFTAPVGTEIYSTGTGVVKQVKTLRSGYGKYVVIDHGFGYETLYGHMSAFNVRKGQKVSRGDVIGYVGNTGKSTGPHLHYEVHKNGKAVNPQYYYFKDLSPQQYDEMITISSNMGQTFD